VPPDAPASVPSASPFGSPVPPPPAKPAAVYGRPRRKASQSVSAAVVAEMTTTDSEHDRAVRAAITSKEHRSALRSGPLPAADPDAISVFEQVTRRSVKQKVTHKDGGN
jgi:hypothetical protein